MRVPANTLKLANDNENGLFTRSDNNNRIALKLDMKSYVDRRSGIDFSRFIVKRVEY